MDFVRQKLTEWELEKYIPVFEENEFNQETFKELEREDIQRLIKPIGARKLFILRHKEMKEREAEADPEQIGLSIPEEPQQQQLVQVFAQLTTAVEGLSSVTGSSKQIMDCVDKLRTHGKFGDQDHEFLRIVERHGQFSEDFAKMEDKSLHLVRMTVKGSAEVHELCGDVLEQELSFAAALTAILSWTRKWEEELSEAAEEHLKLVFRTRTMRVTASNHAIQVNTPRGLFARIISYFAGDVSEERKKMIDDLRDTEACLGQAVGAVSETKDILNVMASLVASILNNAEGRQLASGGERGNIPKRFLSRLQKEARHLEEGATHTLARMDAQNRLSLN